MLAFFTISETGCTCCRSDNRIFGPFKELDSAKSRRESNIASKNFASQYTTTGRHTLGSSEAEQLPDGRLIIGSRVFAGWAEDTRDDEIGHPDEFYVDTYLKD